MVTDWRLPENRREAFQRFYSFHLHYRTHPGCVYFALPAIADHYDLGADQRAWLAWLNGNTQNPAMSLLLLEESNFSAEEWYRAVDFWNDNFRAMDWDTDRRHQKSKFGEATEKWVASWGHTPALDWELAGSSWSETWEYAYSQPYMGRLSAWSMIEYARILLGPSVVPDSDTWLLQDKSGSRSHRNGIAVVQGRVGAENWDADTPFMLGIVGELERFADELLEEAERRNAVLNPDESRIEGVAMYDRHPDVGRLTMESALCTYKSFHKPNRRYPNVYADMMYNRLLKAEARFGKRFQVLWDARRLALPEHLRLESSPNDPGLVPLKQNWYRETGELHYLHSIFPKDMKPSGFELADYEPRKDPTYA